MQRDWGNRESRKRARLKYTIEDRGLDDFRDEVERRLGFKLGQAAALRVHVDRATASAGEQGADEGKWHLTLFVENGRIKDRARLRRCARRCARSPSSASGDFVCTANQNVIIANVAAKAKAEDRGDPQGSTASRSDGRRASAATAWPASRCRRAASRWPRASASCPISLTALEDLLDKAGLKDDDIVIRMTGCPNGCARPYLAEIGLVGRNPGLYNLYLGAAFNGSRLNKLYAEDVDKARIVRAAWSRSSRATPRSARTASTSATSRSVPATCALTTAGNRSTPTSTREGRVADSEGASMLF